MSDKIIDLMFKLKRKCIATDEDIISQVPVSMTEYQIFMVIYYNPSGNSVTCKYIADSIGLSISRVSRILDAMEKKELISRSIDPLDRRYISVKLTDKGQHILADIQKVRNECEKKIMANFNSEELAHLTHDFIKLLDIL